MNVHFLQQNMSCEQIRKSICEICMQLIVKYNFSKEGKLLDFTTNLRNWISLSEIDHVIEYLTETRDKIQSPPIEDRLLGMMLFTPKYVKKNHWIGSLHSYTVKIILLLPPLLFDFNLSTVFQNEILVISPVRKAGIL